MYIAACKGKQNTATREQICSPRNRACPFRFWYGTDGVIAPCGKKGVVVYGGGGGGGCRDTEGGAGGVVVILSWGRGGRGSLWYWGGEGRDDACGVVIRSRLLVARPFARMLQPRLRRFLV